MKRKKRFEKQLQQIDGTLSTIEMQREALEGANTNTAVLTNMKSAADALKAAHQHMYIKQFLTCCSLRIQLNGPDLFFFFHKFYRDVDQVHDMMDDIAEQQDVAREISDAISNPVAFGKIQFIIRTVNKRNNLKFCTISLSKCRVCFVSLNPFRPRRRRRRIGERARRA